MCRDAQTGAATARLGVPVTTTPQIGRQARRERADYSSQHVHAHHSEGRARSTDSSLRKSGNTSIPDRERWTQCRNS